MTLFSSKKWRSANSHMVGNDCRLKGKKSQRNNPSKRQSSFGWIRDQMPQNGHGVVPVYSAHPSGITLSADNICFEIQLLGFPGLNS
jgi:hypothetical protein